MSDEADAIDALCKAVDHVASAIYPAGAAGAHVRDGYVASLTEAVISCAEGLHAIAEGLGDIAEAIKEHRSDRP